MNNTPVTPPEFGVYKISKEKGISIREASIKLAQGEYWDDAVALFKGGK